MFTTSTKGAYRAANPLLHSALSTMALQKKKKKKRKGHQYDVDRVHGDNVLTPGKSACNRQFLFMDGAKYFAEVAHVIIYRESR